MVKSKGSLTVSVAIGILLALIVSIVSSGGIGLLVLKEYVSAEETKYFVIGIQYISVVLGSIVAAKTVMKAPALACGIVTLLYVFVLVAVNIIFLSGNMSGVWSGVLASSVGWITGCAICALKPRKNKYSKVRNR